jgi:hypothetical protein
MRLVSWNVSGRSTGVVAHGPLDGGLPDRLVAPSSAAPPGRLSGWSHARRRRRRGSGAARCAGPRRRLTGRRSSVGGDRKGEPWRSAPLVACASPLGSRRSASPSSCAVLLAWRPPASAQTGGLAHSIELAGTVDPATQGWLRHALADAANQRARLVVVRLASGLSAAVAGCGTVPRPDARCPQCPCRRRSGTLGA